MALGEEIGRKTTADLNQDVHSWADDVDRRARSLIGDLLSALASAAVAAYSDWNKPKG